MRPHRRRRSRARSTCASSPRRNRDLREEVNRGTFRQDLYFRLAVVRLRVPPLRERPDDIPLLVEHFARWRSRGDAAPPFSDETLRSFVAHRWPGNVRELRNAVERLTVIDDVPFTAHAAPEPAEGGAPIDIQIPFKDAKNALTDDFERRYLTAMLEATGGNISEAARRAGIDRVYLLRLMGRYGLRKRRESCKRDPRPTLPASERGRGMREGEGLPIRSPRPAYGGERVRERGPRPTRRSRRPAACRTRTSGSRSPDPSRRSWRTRTRAPRTTVPVPPVPVGDVVLAARTRSGSVRRAAGGRIDAVADRRRAVGAPIAIAGQATCADRTSASCGTHCPTHVWPLHLPFASQTQVGSVGRRRRRAWAARWSRRRMVVGRASPPVGVPPAPQPQPLHTTSHI